MSQIVVALPRLVEFRPCRVNKLMGCVKEEGEVKGYVKFSGDNVTSADVKFEVHSSKTVAGLVHIRSCYNNKYLQLVDDKSRYIAAKADKPEEDQSKRSCTLLRPTSFDVKLKTIRLTHVYLKDNLCWWQELPPHDGWLYACPYSIRDPNLYYQEVFHVIDWQSLVILPKYVAFKGDNNNFLRPLYSQNYYLQFSQLTVEANPRLVGNEIVQASDGNIRIRNMHLNKYWSLRPNDWIWGDSTDSTSNDTLFEPVKCSEDTIALRNVENKLFCKRLTASMESCLNACCTEINMWAKFKMIEFVISKKIDNINFRLMDARIYDEYMVVMFNSTYSNHGSTTQEQTIQLQYRDKKSSTWNCSISMKASVQTSFQVGLPLIYEGDLKLGFEIAGSYTWGETKEVEETISTSYKLTIPPNKKVTLRILATRGTCDVPFTYDQRDVLYTGDTVVTNKDDGVYTGVNNYSYHAEEKEEPLSYNSNSAAAGFKKVAKVSPTGVITRIK